MADVHEVYPTSEDLMKSEAYQHGRTQGRLQIARDALQRIASGQTKTAAGSRAVAKWALETSAGEER